MAETIGPICGACVSTAAAASSDQHSNWLPSGSPYSGKKWSQNQMLSTPSSSARRHASRSSAMVHCCGWMVTPTLNGLPLGAVGRSFSAMVKDLLPREVDVNSEPPEFWARYHAFRRARQAENRPDDPVVPDEIEAARLRRRRDFDIVYRYEISRAGEMLSWFSCGTAKPGAPGY